MWFCWYRTPALSPQETSAESFMLSVCVWVWGDAIKFQGAGMWEPRAQSSTVCLPRHKGYPIRTLVSRDAPHSLIQSQPTGSDMEAFLSKFALQDLGPVLELPGQLLQIHAIAAARTKLVSFSRGD